MSHYEIFLIGTGIFFLITSSGCIIFEATIEERDIPNNKMISFVRKIELPLVVVSAIAHVISMAIW